jgi:nitronate monooxygenase
MGTRFAASLESLAHPEFKQRLVLGGESDTEYVCVFDGGWAGAPHRVLPNSTVKEWNRAGNPGRGHRPGEGERIGSSLSGATIRRYDDTPPVAGMSGDWEACALYAVQSIGGVRAIQPAAEIVAQVVAEARAAITALRSTL